jgi:hypothetical protein
MRTDLYQIIYISTADASLTEEALMELLSESQKRNAARGITGLLLHSDGNIIQIIEGPEHSAKELYAKIEADPRHRGVTQMSSKAIERRDFPNFKMGFKRTNPRDIEQYLPNFSDIVESHHLDIEALDKMSRLVSTFIKTFAQTTNIDRFGAAS